MAPSLTRWLESHITLHTHDDRRDEWLNSATHVVGTALSLSALIAILFKFPQIPSAPLRAGLVIWAATMILLYSASALYHALPHSNAKRVCRILDHSNIYFLIAGTYTPLMLYIGTPTAHLVVALVWIFALLGIVFTLVFWDRYGAVHVGLYILMGWLIVFFARHIFPHLPPGLLAWVISAGVTYTAGVLFYANKKIPHYHAIWHLFCIGGSALFFFGYWFNLI
ncbi:MAG: hemolysin III family protein [Sphaerochaeta sp.]|jgi:hemolysin III|nr:hemolysin III family protein [Sphaerochaeta sp.]MDX9916289.1 hemolysin III family protein [Sphaerochaeta sp.]